MKLLIHNIKYNLQKLINKLGWHISKHEPKRSEGNIYLIQKTILENVDVKIIFDVGAWIGNTTVDYRHYFPLAEIHAFEPFPESYDRYVEQHSDNTSIYSHQKAISDKNGKASFYSNKVETTNSLLETASTNSKHDFYRDTIDKIEVETITLDKYCDENNISRINILKMDTQGGELKALKGAEQLLKSKSIDIIYCEISFIEMYKNTPLYHHLINYLEHFGYYTHNIYGLNLNERGELAWGDAIFCSSNFRENIN